MESRHTNLSYAHGPVKPPDLESRLATKTDYSIIETMQQNMVALCRGRGIPIVYMTQKVIDPVFEPYVDEVNDRIRRLNDPGNKCFVLDLDRAILYDPELSADKLHLTEAGCAAAAQHMTQFLVEQGLIAGVLTSAGV